MTTETQEATWTNTAIETAASSPAQAVDTQAGQHSETVTSASEALPQPVQKEPVDSNTVNDISNTQSSTPGVAQIPATEAEIKALYLDQDLLGREADEGGLAYWSGRAKTEGLTKDAIKMEFQRSTECLQRAACKKLVIQDSNLM